MRVADGAVRQFNHTSIRPKAIGQMAVKYRQLRATFNRDNNASVEVKEALIMASRSIWLGLWSDFRTIDPAKDPTSWGRVKTLLAV